MQKICTQKIPKNEKTHRNCKNHTKNDISGTTDILPVFSPYWLSPITSFHHIGDNRYYRDILESVTSINRGYASFSDICGGWFGFGSGFGIGFTLTLLLARPDILAESQPALKFRVNRPRPRSQPARAAGRVCWLFIFFHSS
jgi:hypothetical protein